MAQTYSSVKRIALIGAESTGKTTLARSIAMRFQTVWVPEYAREYMAINAGEYTADVVVDIAREQLSQEEELVGRANKIIITDTELLTSAIWCEDVFGYCPEWILSKIKEHRYDLFLLTSNDLPWIADPVRVNPQRRDYFFNWYREELERLNFKYEIVTGRYEARLLCAVKALKRHFPDLS
jgi:NadR type nicotinamide-nucleotide adenylyltransferase